MAPVDIAAWLADLGLSKYAGAFQENHIDASLLAELTSDDLKELGVVSVGHRKRLLAAAAALAGPAAPAPAPGSPREAERRQVTILFADITGYTSLSSSLDPEDLHRLLTRYTEVVDGVIAHCGGTVDKHIGDAVMALFGAPVAHGDDPLRAARAALGIHAAMEELSTEFGRELSVHVGMASGEVVAAPMARGEGRDYTVLGDAVNLAARLDAMARGGETLASESVARALEGQAAFELLGERALKGIASPVRVHRLLQVGVRGGVRTPFVGRREELARIEALLEAAARGAGGRLVLRGEPGVGKTRLVEEAIRAGATRGFALHRGLILDFGVGAGQDATSTVVRSLLGIAGDAEGLPDEAAVREAGERLRLPVDLAALLYDAAGVPVPAELRADLDALAPSAKAAARRRLLAELVAESARRRPLLVVVEDLHWADLATLESVEVLGEATRDSRLLLVMTTRPDMGPGLRRSLAAAGAEAEIVDLAPLSPGDSRALVAAAGDDPALLDTIVTRSGGNPLFLEQLVKSAHEGAAALPASIQSLVLARLDCLRGRDREALQVASVLGQRLELATLGALLGDPGYDAAELLDRGLLRPDAASLMFVHALVQEGVYSSLMHARRREIHRAAADHFAGRDLMLQARHLGRAEDPGAGAVYLEAARARAAASHTEEALDLIASALALPATTNRPALANLKGQILMDLGSIEGAIGAFEDALASGAGEGDACRARTGLANCHRITDRYPEALAELQRAQELVSACGSAERARIHAVRGSVYFPMGRVDECRAEQTAALEQAIASADPDIVAVALSGLADAEYARGHVRSAAALYRRCVVHCEAHGLGRHVNVNRAMEFGTRFLDLDLDGILESSDRVRRDAARVGQLRAETVVGVLRLIYMSEVVTGRDATAEALACEERARRLGSPRFVGETLGIAARILLHEGRVEDARAKLADALAVARASGLAFFGPVLLGAAARLAVDDAERRAAIAEGEELLALGSVCHNHLGFRRDAIQACLDGGDPEGALRQIAALDAYASGERSGWVDFWTSYGRVLVAVAQGQEAEIADERRRVAGRARSLGLEFARRALEG